MRWKIAAVREGQWPAEIMPGVWHEGVKSGLISMGREAGLGHCISGNGIPALWR
jgi:hypothetical protein